MPILEFVADDRQSIFGPGFKLSPRQNAARAPAYLEYRSVGGNTSAQQSKKGELPKCCPKVSIVTIKDER
jgi:hypothetical protein